MNITQQVEKEYEWGEIIPGKGKHYPLHEFQLEVYNSTTRFTAAIAGTGGGKTVVGPLWLAKQILETKGRGLYMVIAPTYKVLSRATVPCLLETFADTPLEGIYFESKNLYVLPNDKGKIWCQGADNPGGLEGGQFDAIWGDEAGQFRQGVWTAIQKRTGKKKGKILLTTTPYSKNWLYYNFVEHWRENDPDYKVVQWSSVANPQYPIEEYERAHRTMPPERAAMEYDGQFTSLRGLVYPKYESCIVSGVNPKDIIVEGKLRGAIDFGWNDPFCALSGCLLNDTLWIWYERYKSETPIEEHANHLPKFENRSLLWWADHNPELIRKLRLGGHRVVKAKKDIKAGIDAVNARMYSGRLKIIKESCPALIAELGSYRFPEEDEMIIGDKPIDEDNHACDALRYMVAGIDLRRAA